ncbi:MAG: tetratricopeptide repeat protein, partial [Anaerolineae bacterium]
MKVSDNTRTSDSHTAQKFKAAMQRAKRGDRARARQLFMEVLEVDPNNEEAWLWLAGVAATLEDAKVYLETVLAINPEHKKAREGLRWLSKQLG